MHVLKPLAAGTLVTSRVYSPDGLLTAEMPTARYPVAFEGNTTDAINRYFPAGTLIVLTTDHASADARDTDPDVSEKVVLIFDYCFTHRTERKRIEHQVNTHNRRHHAWMRRLLGVSSKQNAKAR